MLIPRILRWLASDVPFFDCVGIGGGVGVVIMLGFAFPPFGYGLLTLFALDLCILLARGIYAILLPLFRWQKRRAEAAREEARAKQAAEQASSSRELARIEAVTREEQQRLVAAHNAVEPAIADIRRHWANCFDVIGDRCSLKDVNDEIERALHEPSPHAALQRLAALKDSMTRDAVRIRAEQLYKKLAPYISEIVPREEFDRLMREASTRSSSAQDYGNRLLQLGDWLGSIAGPAKGRWDEEREQEQVVAYERLFAEGDADDADENPFEDAVETQRESRAG